MRANPASGRVLVEFDPEAVPVEEIIGAIAGAKTVQLSPTRQKLHGEPGLAGEVLRLALSGAVMVGLFIGRLAAGGPFVAATPSQICRRASYP